MYWGQIAGATVVGLVVAGLLFDFGYGSFASLSVGVIAFMGTRWLFAWGFRTRYWLGRDGAKSTTCPSCNQYIYRLRGDIVLECKRCGWKPLVPGLRLLTHSVPVKQLKRTVLGPGLIIVLLLSAGVVFGIAGELDEGAIDPGGEADDDGLQSPDGDGNGDAVGSADGSADGEADGSDDGASSESSPPDSSGSSDDGGGFDSGEGWNTTVVEEQMVEKINAERDARGLAALSFNERAQEAAMDHVKDMAENAYFNHTSPDGETQEERYSFCAGGENLAQTWIERDIATEFGTVERYTTESELADGLVRQWMWSDPHRERGILGPWWTSGAAAVTITERGTVYAAFAFCSK